MQTVPVAWRAVALAAVFACAGLLGAPAGAAPTADTQTISVTVPTITVLAVTVNGHETGGGPTRDRIRLSVRAAGNAAATDASVAFEIPPGSRVLRGSGGAARDADMVHWKFSTLPVGSKRTVWLMLDHSSRAGDMPAIEQLTVVQGTETRVAGWSVSAANVADFIVREGSPTDARGGTARTK